VIAIFSPVFSFYDFIPVFDSSFICFLIQEVFSVCLRSADNIPHAVRKINLESPKNSTKPLYISTDPRHSQAAKNFPAVFNADDAVQA